MIDWRRSSKSWLKISGLTIIVLLLLFPVRISRSCGPVDLGFQGYSFINPDIVNRWPGLSPFFLPFEKIHEAYEGQSRIQIKENVIEWHQRFCEIPRVQDMYEIIYKYSVDEMKQLRTAISSKNIPLDYRTANNSFARYLDRNKCFEAIDYLIFAKQCEPYVVRPYAWEDTQRTKVVMERLIDIGTRAFMKTESHYFRLRYAYQLVRLAHYAKNYQQTLDLYDYLMPKIDNDPSIIEYWILGHKAGALLKLGKNVEASYLYSLIFDKCPSKRESAFRSFTIKSDKEWRQCMLMCVDDHQRAMLHVLRANTADARALEEMWEIYRLEPSNPSLELLLVKEIAKLEKELLGLEFNDPKRATGRSRSLPHKFAGTYVIDMQKFVRKVLSDKLVNRLEVWKIAEGYLELLAGDYYEASQTFRIARDMVTNDTIEKQLEIFELALKISAYDHIDEETEKEIWRVKRQSDAFEADEDFTAFLNDKFSWLYRQEGHPGKAFLLQYPLRALKASPKIDIIDDLLAVTGENNPTKFETELVEQGDSTIRNDLLDIKATHLFSQSQLEAALEVMKEMDRVGWDNYGLYSPFVEKINDCVYCLLPDTVEFFNRGEVIEEILDMEYDARAEIDDNKSAWIYYRIGNAFYNMTYFGYSWKAMDYYRSGASLSKANLADGDNIIPHYYFPFGNREVFDCSRALYYYDRARMLARDPDLAARATFMAAKCEQNEYFVNRYQGAQRTYKYFNILMDNYSDTPFYIRAINECKYFEAFATK